MVFGHVPIVSALVRIAKMLNFNVRVVDKQATKEALSEADAVYSSFDEFRAKSKRDSFDKMYAVVATMGERDQEFVHKLCELDFQYVGVIAGKKRASDLISYLRNNDVSEEMLARIRSPAGIFIRAVTAEEIALSLLAEIVELARTKSSDVEKFQVSNATLAERSVVPSSSSPSNYSKKEEVFVDPVCGMTVDSSSEYLVKLEDGRIVYFCCSACREAFEGAPANYVLENIGS